jgi:hypothetical protein
VFPVRYGLNSYIIFRSNIRERPSSRQRGCYIRIMAARVQLKKKISGREPQGAWRLDELIGGKPQIVT